jgi:CRISPR system Cascade subunit CasB
MRFQTLIRTEKPADLIRPLRRALIQIDQSANVAALARDLFYWGEATRNRWCFDYYGAAVTAPEPVEETEA